MIIACCFRVAALSSHAALALSPSGIAPELNRIQLSAVCRGGQSDRVIFLLARRCLPLGLPSAANGVCAVVQKSPSKRQCGERQASLKAALLKPLHLPYNSMREMGRVGILARLRLIDPLFFSLDAQVSTYAYHYASTWTRMYLQWSRNILWKIIDSVPFLSTKLLKYLELHVLN